MLKKNEFRCYDMNIEESEKVGSCQESNPGHLWQWSQSQSSIWLVVHRCMAVVDQLQSSGSSSQRCLGFDYRRLPAFSLSSIFVS